MKCQQVIGDKTYTRPCDLRCRLRCTTCRMDICSIHWAAQHLEHKVIRKKVRHGH